MSNQIQKVSALSTSQVAFSEARKQGKTMNVAYVQYKPKGAKRSTRLIAQTPKMFCPFGANYYNPNNEKIDMPKYSVAFSLKKDEGKVSQLRKFLEDLDTMVIDEAMKNKNWLKLLKVKKPVRAVLENVYSGIIKESRDEKYPPTFVSKVPIDWNNSSLKLDLYDKSQNNLHATFDNIEELLPKLSEMRALIHVSHIWFVGGKFGVALKLVQGIVYQRESISGFAFCDESDTEEDAVVEEEEEEDEVVEIEVSDDEDSDDE